jgi:hypothetical protein
MIYWVTESFVTTVRYYKEAALQPWTPSHNRRPIVEAPTGAAVWPREVILLPRKWMEGNFNLKRVTTMPAGGHFAPMEEPDLMVQDIREFFASLKDAA